MEAVRLHINAVQGAGINPEQIIFESWDKYPARTLPERDPAALSSLIGYFLNTTNEPRNPGQGRGSREQVPLLAPRSAAYLDRGGRAGAHATSKPTSPACFVPAFPTHATLHLCEL
jgi:hypothetical protein